MINNVDNFILESDSADIVNRVRNPKEELSLTGFLLMILIVF